MIDITKVADKILRIIKGHGFKVKAYSSTGIETIDPEEARMFYVTNPNVMIIVDEELDEIRFNKSKDESLDEVRSLLDGVRTAAVNSLMDFTLRNYNKEIKPRHFSREAYKSKKREDSETVQESKFSKPFGSKKVSRHALEDVRVKVKHTKPVDEEKVGSRSRNIKSIYLERGEERFKFPENNLSAAKAAARHLKSGGELWDDIGQRICEVSKNYRRLREFLFYTRNNGMINESNYHHVTDVRETMSEIRKDFKSISRPVGYEKNIDSFMEKSYYVNGIEEGINTVVDSFGLDESIYEEFSDIMPLVKAITEEKGRWRSYIEEQSHNPIEVVPEDLDTSLYEFDSLEHEMSYKVKALSEFVNDDMVKSYLNEISNKLKNGQKIDQFEHTVLSNMLNNATSVGDRKQEINENSSFFNKTYKEYQKTMNNY